jgi:HAD superfamily hydrolase (TIGR01509 family)
MRRSVEEIYRLAVDTTQRHPEECLFIDDRTVNVECADRVGIPTIQFHQPAQLKDDLELRGVTD